MKLKNFLMAGLTLATVAPVAPIAAKAEAGITITKQKEGIVKPVRTAKQVVREDAGGLQVITTRIGIPPHIYGQHHVKRGTHRKTNK